MHANLRVVATTVAVAVATSLMLKAGYAKSECTSYIVCSLNHQGMARLQASPCRGFLEINRSVNFLYGTIDTRSEKLVPYDL